MDLKFDKMTVDTTLAQNYLGSERKLSKLQQLRVPSATNYSKLIEVADKIKEQTNMLAQLEYMQRKIPIDDTITQIKLIVQYINYIAKYARKTEYRGMISIEIIGDDPLIKFGAIAKALALNNNVHIVGDETTEAICCFITGVYKVASFPVSGSLSTEESVYSEQKLKIPFGTIGVISENSDVDSAVDVFLTSSSKAPWRLLKILVQESAYQQFKNALVWKCNLNKQNLTNSGTSPDVLEYNGRDFLMDTAGFTKSKSSGVTIEAYRTRKELKSLLNVYQTDYLSLWANDIAEINEIGYGSNSPIVWVNNYGDFRGPSKVFEVVCSYTPCVQIPKEIGIYELKESWQKLDFETRRDILCKVLDEVGEDECSIYKDIQKELATTFLNDGSFVDVGNDYVCTGLPLPSNEIFSVDNTYIFTSKFFKAVLKGNAFIAFDDSKGQNKTDIISIFQKFRVPVVFKEYPDLHFLTRWLPHQSIDVTQNFKIIWNNSGTIFAN